MFYSDRFSRDEDLLVVNGIQPYFLDGNSSINVRHNYLFLDYSNACARSDESPMYSVNSFVGTYRLPVPIPSGLISMCPINKLYCYKEQDDSTKLEILHVLVKDLDDPTPHYSDLPFFLNTLKLFSVLSFLPKPSREVLAGHSKYIQDRDVRYVVMDSTDHMTFFRDQLADLVPFITRRKLGGAVAGQREPAYRLSNPISLIYFLYNFILFILGCWGIPSRR